MEEHRHEPTVHHQLHLQVRSASPCAADSTSHALPTRPGTPGPWRQGHRRLRPDGGT
jgi:hypothetical protein